MEKSVLFVCMGNICRSPMAMAIGQRLAENAGGGAWKFDSAGTHAEHHAGARPDPRANAVLRKHGYAECKHRARRIATRDFERFDLIVAMDRANLAELRRQCPGDLAHKIRLLLDFVPSQRGEDVPDPYYGSVEGFERVFELCEAGVAGLLASGRGGA